MSRIHYGTVGYTRVQQGQIEEIGDLVDFIDPLGIRKIPGQIKAKVDGYVEQKSQRAANLASQRVEAGVKKAINDTGKNALMVAAGGVLVGGTIAGVMLYRKHKQETEGTR